MTDPAAIADVLPGLDTMLAEEPDGDTPLRHVLGLPPFNLDRRTQTALIKKWRDMPSVGVDCLIEVLECRFWLRTSKRAYTDYAAFLRNHMDRAVRRKLKQQADQIRHEHGPEPQAEGYVPRQRIEKDDPPSEEDRKAWARMKEEAGL